MILFAKPQAAFSLPTAHCRLPTMRLAYSSNAYQNFPIEETVARIAALGYAGMELLADVPHAWPAGLLEGRKRAIRECLEQHRLAISNVNGFMMNAVADPRQPYWHPSWIEPDPHYRAIRREHTKRALRLARELGAASIQTEPGGPLAEGQSWQAAADVSMKSSCPASKWPNGWASFCSSSRSRA